MRAHLGENELRQGKVDSFVRFVVSIAAKPGEVKFEFDVEAADPGAREDQFGWDVCASAVVDECGSGKDGRDQRRVDYRTHRNSRAAYCGFRRGDE